MPRASKKTINQKLIKELSEKLTNLISSLKTQEYISQFLETFLTDEEMIMISKRLMLYILIGKGLSTNQIVGVLGISRQTVLTHRKNWGKSGNIYRIIMKKMGESKQSGIMEKINDALYPLNLIIESRSNMKARAKLYQADFRKPKKTIS